MGERKLWVEASSSLPFEAHHRSDNDKRYAGTRIIFISPRKSSSSTKTSIARTGLSSTTYSSRNSGSKTRCVRSLALHKALHQEPRLNPSGF
jgi:hypothetical protein